MLSIFLCAFWAIRMSSLKKCLFRFSAHVLIGIFFFSLSYMILFYILEINPLSVAPFANIFSHFVGSPTLWSPLLCKVLGLIRFHLFMFVFIILGDGSKKLLLQFMSQGFYLHFSPRVFKVSSVTFSCLIHFEFIFVFGVR